MGQQRVRNFKGILVAFAWILLIPQNSSAFNPHRKFSIKKISMHEAARQIALRPKDPQPYCDRGDMYLTAGEEDLALEDYNRALVCDKNSALAHLRLSYVLEMKGANDKAMKEAELCLKTNDKKYAAEGLMQKISILTREGRDIECIPIYTTLISGSVLHVGANDRAVLLLDRANAYLKLNKPTLALQDTAAALKINPNASVNLLKYRARAHVALKNYSAAIDDLSSAIKDRSRGDVVNLGKLYRERAQVYLKLGKPALAKRDETTARQLDSENFDLAPFVSR